MRAPKTVMHALRDCYMANQLWNKIIPLDKSAVFFSLAYHLWNNRNCAIFQFSALSIEDMLKRIVYEFDYFFSCSRSKVLLATKQLKPQSMVKWKPPLKNQFKFNTDGFVEHELRAASCGALIQDHIGAFIAGFHNSI
ncbi:uncharacterized protein LOC113862273 [Abrus precatorius]|uniref:Uncharacterized protein LOC113862273 n=1 Tax=Abrus precatorius TaxID=3816 RepID=A0A8B8L8V1_ABRPR|nr:uncharacterized protein LOC113862273 [Abrus precatorius]